MKALVGAFNQEKALVGAFSVIVIVKTDCETEDASSASSVHTGPSLRAVKSTLWRIDRFVSGAEKIFKTVTIPLLWNLPILTTIGDLQQKL